MPFECDSDSVEPDETNGALTFALRRARCLHHHMGHTRGPSITHARIQAFELVSLMAFLLAKKQV